MKRRKETRKIAVLLSWIKRKLSDSEEEVPLDSGPVGRVDRIGGDGHQFDGLSGHVIWRGLGHDNVW